MIVSRESACLHGFDVVGLAARRERASRDHRTKWTNREVDAKAQRPNGVVGLKIALGHNNESTCA